MKSVSDVGEFKLINSLTSKLNKYLPRSVLGVGDDCAVLPLNVLSENVNSSKLIVTTDTLVENVHFKWNFTSAKDLGWKILAVSISDIAAMGGVPKAALINLKVQKNLPVEILEEIYAGFKELLDIYQIDLIGGDTVGAEENSFTATLLGVCERPPLLRSGAQIGDDLWVSGEIGAAFCGLYCLKEEITSVSSLANFVRAYNRPQPRVELAQALSEKHLVNSMLDISDGLLQDASHISEESGVSIMIKDKDIPLALGYQELNLDVSNLMTGGDDYELLFSAPKENTAEILALSEKLKIKLSKIGEVQAKKGELLFIESEAKLLTAVEYLKTRGMNNLGYSHFTPHE
ncbi:MAG: thiamine-phosphate kinase [Proteobacteria bacterium]|nr:thiamine-phosphate kinase [Pseudomonadota bacterium]